ncbi:MAG: hypothetical protein ACXVEF_01285 [Polyangiales bacterium]
MAPNLEAPVPIRVRGGALEIDGDRLYPELSVEGALFFEDIVISTMAWAVLCAMRRVRRKAVLRFAPGVVTIVEGERETAIPTAHVGTRSAGSKTRLVAMGAEGWETPLPGPPLLPLETAEILDEHVRVVPVEGYR